MKLYRFALLFFDDTVITGKFCIGVPLNNQSIYLYLSIYFCLTLSLHCANVIVDRGCMLHGLTWGLSSVISLSYYPSNVLITVEGLVFYGNIEYKEK